MMPEPFDRVRALDGLDWLDAIYGGDVAEGAPSQMRDVADAARWAVEVTEGDGIWWCEKHRSRFLEKQPSERSLCLYSLHEDNFNAVGWEDCVPVRARVVIEREQK